MKGAPSFRGRKQMKKITLGEYAKLLNVSHYPDYYGYGKLRAKMARKRLEQSSLTAPKDSPKDSTERELFLLIKEEIERSNGNIVSFRLAIGQRSENPTHCLMQWVEKFCKRISLKMWYFVWVEFYILPGEDSPNGEKLYPERRSDWQRYKLYQRLFYQNLKNVARKLGLKATFFEKEDTVLLTLI